MDNILNTQWCPQNYKIKHNSFYKNMFDFIPKSKNTELYDYEKDIYKLLFNIHAKFIRPKTYNNVTKEAFYEFVNNSDAEFIEYFALDHLGLTDLDEYKRVWYHVVCDIIDLFRLAIDKRQIKVDVFSYEFDFGQTHNDLSDFIMNEFIMKILSDVLRKGVVFLDIYKNKEIIISNITGKPLNIFSNNPVDVYRLFFLLCIHLYFNKREIELLSKFIVRDDFAELLDSLGRQYTITYNPKIFVK